MAIQNIVKKLVAWKKNITGRKAIFLVFLVIFAVGLFFIVDPTYATGAGAASGPSSNDTSWVADIWNSILKGISFLMMAVAQVCLQLIMFVLSFVIQLASYNGYLNSTAVNTGWVLIRDLTNMIFVVALLAIAFGTILGVENYEWKHMLFKLVSAAILVNFSRIICGIIIDISQVVMMTFLSGISATLGGNIIRAFNLEKIFGFDPTVNGASIDAYSAFTTAAAALFISVTILVVMVILLAMLIARMVVLWVLIVLSPVAFVLSILRKTEAYAAEWWSSFGANVITGPVLVFFLWLTLVTVGNGVVGQNIVENASIKEVPPNSGIAKVLTSENLINFSIAIGMLLVGINVTKRLGGIGSDWAGKAVDYGKKATYFASGAFVARAAAQKVKEGAVAGGRRVGGIALQPLARAGGMAKNLAIRKVAAPALEWRNKTIAELLKEKEGAKGLGKLKAGFKASGLDLLTGSAYAKEMAKKREEENAARLETAGRLKSTSSTAPAQRTLKAERRLQEITRTGGVRKSQKETQEDERRAKAHEIYISTKDVSKRTKALEDAGYSREEIKQFESNDFERSEGATSAQAKAESMERFIGAQQQKTLGEARAKLQSKVTQVPGREITRGNVTDEPNGVYTDVDFRKFLNDRKVVDPAIRQKFIDEFNNGNSIHVPIDVSLEVDHTEASYQNAISKIDELKANKDISPEEHQKLKQNVDFNYREAVTAEFEKRASLANREVTESRNLKSARADETLRATNKEYVKREGRIDQMTSITKQLETKLAVERQEELLREIARLLSTDLDYQRRESRIAGLQAGNKQQEELISEGKKSISMQAVEDQEVAGRGTQATIERMRAETRQREERLSGIKKQQASDAEMERMSGSGRILQEEIDTRAAKTKQTEEEISGTRERDLQQRRRAYLGTAAGRQAQERIYAINAERVNVSEISDLQREEQTLRARAADYRSRGDVDRAEAFVATANSLSLQKAREATKGLRGNEIIARIKSIAEQLKNANADVQRTGSAQDIERRDQFAKMMQAARSTAMTQEAWVGKAADIEIAKELGITADERAQMTDQQFNLSLDMGQKIGSPDDLSSMAMEQERRLGGRSGTVLEARERAQAFLRDRTIAIQDGGLARFRKEAAGSIAGDSNAQGRVIYRIYGSTDLDTADRAIRAGQQVPLQTVDVAAQRTASQDEYLAWARKLDIVSAPNAPISNRFRDDNGNIAMRSGIPADAQAELDLFVEKISDITLNQYSRLGRIKEDLGKASPQFRSDFRNLIQSRQNKFKDDKVYDAIMQDLA